MNQYMARILPIFCLVVLSCNLHSEQQTLKPDVLSSDSVIFQGINLMKNFYQTGQIISGKISLKNTSHSPERVDSIVVTIVPQMPNAVGSNMTVATNVSMQAQATDHIEFQFRTPFSEGKYFAFGRLFYGPKSSPKSYLTFFQVLENQNPLIRFSISSNHYNGLPVYKLDGGMSAELAVEKSAESLTAGISHSWSVSKPGFGPNAVLSTPDFLTQSLNYVVQFYDSILGSRQVDNMIIGTGIPSAAYLALGLKAPFLPIHFLVGTNSVAEVNTILKSAESKGTPAYATVGYDPSVVGGVAWIKLMCLPEAYLDFMRRHGVKNVLVFGYSGTGGESVARKTVDAKENFESGSVYILYPQGGTANDQSQLQQRFLDWDTLKLGNYQSVADWESGIAPPQMSTIVQTIKNQIGATRVTSIDANSDLALWDLGTKVTAFLLTKNRQTITGVSLNPYLIGHPVFEAKMGYIPLLFWQGNPNAATIDRLKTQMSSLHLDYTQLNYWVNSSNNFAGNESAALFEALKFNGISSIRQNDVKFDEVWNLYNGVNAPCEIRAKELASATTPDQLKKWLTDLAPLTIDDLSSICATDSRLRFVEH